MDRRYSRDFLTVDDDKSDDDSYQSVSDIMPEDESPMEEVHATIPSMSFPKLQQSFQTKKKSIGYITGISSPLIHSQHLLSQPLENTNS